MNSPPVHSSAFQLNLPPPLAAVDRWETRLAMDGVNDAAAPVLVSVGRFVVLFDRCLLGAALVPLLTCMVLQ